MLQIDGLTSTKEELWDSNAYLLQSHCTPHTTVSCSDQGEERKIENIDPLISHAEKALLKVLTGRIWCHIFSIEQKLASSSLLML